MTIDRVSAFSYNNQGGNPAGVAVCATLPSEETMLAIAKDVGYSETAFLEKQDNGWRIRYFSPETEIPFCGHATIASTAVLGERFGEGDYVLHLNNDKLNVNVFKNGNNNYVASLQSPQTYCETVSSHYINQVLDTFELSIDDINPDFPTLFAYAGAKHIILVLDSRSKLQSMKYNFERLKTVLAEQEVTTVNLLWKENDRLFHSRNPFPMGGIYEDAATGAAAAAFAGYLRELGHKESAFEILQGFDMGSPSQLFVEYTPTLGASIKVSGQTRYL